MTELISIIFLGLVGMCTPGIIDSSRRALKERGVCCYVKTGPDDTAYQVRWYSAFLSSSSLSTISLSALAAICLRIIVLDTRSHAGHLLIGVITFFAYWFIFMTLSSYSILLKETRKGSNLLFVVYALLPFLALLILSVKLLNRVHV